MSGRRVAGLLAERVASLLKAGLRDLSGEEGAGSPPQLGRIDQTLADLREQLGLALARRRLHENSIAERGRAAEGLMAKAAIAIAAGREDLARAAIEHQQEAAARSVSDDAELAALTAEIEQLEALAASLAAARREVAGSPSGAPARTAALAELDALAARIGKGEPA